MKGENEMFMMQVGTNYYKQLPQPVYFIQGNAIRNGEYAPIQGKPHGKVAVAAAQTKEGESIFVTLNGWREKADQVARVKKMDSVFAVGILKIKKLGGATYYDMDVEFIGISGMGLENRVLDLDCLPEEMERTRRLWKQIQDEKAMM